VSRPSLREAFRILETEGLAKVRRGKRGGTIVKHPTAENAAHHVSLLLHSRGTNLEDLAAARKLLEPLCAEQAAQRRDHVSLGRKLASLCESDEQIEDGVAFTTLGGDFHQELVEAAGNSTLQVLTGILESVWNTQEINWAQSSVDEGDYPEVKLRRDVLGAHLRISRAIEAGDPDEAARLTRGHVKASTRFVTSGGGQVRAIDDYGGRRHTRLA
jgi:DNA-binding FadR family transcriptional regulator